MYSPAITDFTFMVDDTSHMFITGPDVIKAVTGEVVTFDDLGGSQTHTAISGVADNRYASEPEMFAAVKQLLTCLPSNNLDATTDSVDPSTQAQYAAELEIAQKKIGKIVPANPNLPYDMGEVIRCVVDPGSFVEMKPEFAPHIITAFARLGGIAVGVVGNNPNSLAGCSI